MIVIGLMVASFKAIPSAQCNSRPLQHNSLLLWHVSPIAYEFLLPVNFLSWSQLKDTGLWSCSWYCFTTKLRHAEFKRGFPRLDHVILSNPSVGGSITQQYKRLSLSLNGLQRKAFIASTKSSICQDWQGWDIIVGFTRHTDPEYN